MRKRFGHTEICSFVKTRPLPLSEITAPMHMRWGPSPADCSTSKQTTAMSVLLGVSVLHTAPLLILQVKILLIFLRSLKI